MRLSFTAIVQKGTILTSVFPQGTLDHILNLTASHAELDGLRGWLRDGYDALAGSDGWANEVGASLLTNTEINPQTRVALGQALGLLNLDKRPGVNLREDGLPDIAWCDVPAGAFLMGSNKKADPYAYRIETPQHEVIISQAYQIAKYPVTWFQFQVFADSEAYNDPDYWLDFPAGYCPQRLENQAFQYANHPRDNVSWYQAVAFCRWLTWQYQTANLITEQQEIRLPTEQEWEKAARGTDGRVYPYGYDFEPEFTNVSEMELNQTNAVGIFPQGASPYGALDMSGNICEWCLTKYGDLQDQQIDASGATRGLRGGSYFLRSEWSRCAYRYEREPGIQFKDFGFRPVLVTTNP